MRKSKCGPARVTCVEPGSPADLAGIRCGDNIWKIKGTRLRDIIDLRMALADDGTHRLEVERAGRRFATALNLLGHPPGLEFSDSIFDQVKTCGNNCIFCFVDQLPDGLRDSVYVKDDDYRLSFLGGNFITLTNMKRADVKRVVMDRLSPLYVSLHSTEPAVRKKLFGNSDAPRALKILKELLNASIKVHIQIVLVRGVNDGKRLDVTLHDLLDRYSGVSSVGIVPVGISTGGRKAIPDAYGYDAASSADVLEQVDRWRPDFGAARIGAADEFYFMAGTPPPEADCYGEYPQCENGIGIVRQFMESYKKAARQMPLCRGACAGVTLITTPIGYWALALIGIEETGVSLLVCENTLFGSRVNVCGLLSGKDVARNLSCAPGVSLALVPDVALDDDFRFIDGTTLADVSRESGVNVESVSANGEALVKALKTIEMEGT
ncbi:MAG: DUF512 domain-containing protein [Candidatus Anoxymicrobium japonicum]|uniref:DUF512 domain-containing protein n=1 Tax=Candidatus Anoxymicrobium japonicum TaxID=2013648 RepID=A0A2N3G4X0_9ACTN|nr:MAG: DUF512 domain-containing protein [Candidatus Anoxymicrobium japonicum]